MYGYIMCVVSGKHEINHQHHRQDSCGTMSRGRLSENNKSSEHKEHESIPSCSIVYNPNIVY